MKKLTKKERRYKAITKKLKDIVNYAKESMLDKMIAIWKECYDEDIKKEYSGFWKKIKQSIK